ncbi:MAG: hypothetical protein K2Y29_09805 [Beijerinckiaceae bacterium]|nr:hypothetical protein [Beijerinckiaceae bacterium]
MRERPYQRLLSYYVMLAGAVYACALILTVGVVFKNMETNGAAKREQLVHTAQLFREHVERIFGNVDWIIETARNAYIASPTDIVRLESTLAALGRREEFAFYVTLADTSGVSIASSLGTEKVDLSDREHVRAQLAPDANGVFIGEPRTSPRTGRLGVNISQRIYDEDGTWLGIAIVSFDPARVSESLARLSINGTGIATLIRNDGVVLARSPPTLSLLGLRFNPLADAAMQQQRGSFVLASPIDNIERLFAFERFARLPLTALVGIDYDYFDRERTDWLLLGALWMGLLALSLLGIGFVIRKFLLAEEMRQAQQLAEAERVHAAELIRSSFNSAGVFVVVFDENALLRFTNGPARELIENLATPREDMLRELQQADRGAAGQFAPTTTHWVRLRDGSMRTICWSMASAKWVGPDCYVAVGFDRTDAENLERMLNQKARLTALGEIAVGIAHEVAQPLTIINFTTRRMEREPERPEVQAEGMAVIKNAATRAGRLLAQIKTFSKKHDQGRDAIFDVGESVGAVALLMRRQLEKSRIELRVCGPECAVFARADPHLLEQILLNLVLNARDAILEAQGERREAFIAVGWSAGQGSVQIRVSDSGPGIPASAQARVFEPFFTTKSGGTGLGLSLSFAMARQMGGSLALEPGAKGAVFLIELPQGHADEDAVEPAEAGA